MQPFNVVLLQCDPRVAESMAASLSPSFPSIHSTHSMAKLQSSIALHRPAVAIVDLEMISMNDVERLCHDFSDVKVICTHRLADEEMWTQALTAGAVDVCRAYDSGGVASSAIRSTSSSSAKAV
jgi:DNA-binding NarL/FixJ family response regulator